MGSLLNPLVLDGLLYGFAGLDIHRLVAVHILAAAFKTSPAYSNVLDDPAVVWDGLEASPVNQMFHPYVNIGTLPYAESSC